VNGVKANRELRAHDRAAGKALKGDMTLTDRQILSPFYVDR